VTRRAVLAHERRRDEVAHAGDRVNATLPALLIFYAAPDQKTL
jgi:hypothetical protein